MLNTTIKQQKPQKFIDINPVEALKNIGNATAKTTTEEMRSSMKSFWEQLLGSGEYKKSTPEHKLMNEGQDYVLPKSTREMQHSERRHAAYNYTNEILHYGERATTERNKEIEHQLKQIIQELERLAASSVVLEKAVVAATGQSIAKPGEYHLSFFQWMLLEIRQARMQIEDAGAWLATITGKKAKRGYWNMAKKHGTTFLLSGERTVSTQTA